MADIKTRESLHTVKTFDRVQNLAAKTRNGVDEAKQEINDTTSSGESSESEYAGNRLEAYESGTVHLAVRAGDRIGRWGVRETRRNIQKWRNRTKKIKAEAAKPKELPAPKQTPLLETTKTVAKGGSKAVQTTTKVTSQTAKGAAKTTKYTVKTTEKAAKDTAKTAKTAAKATAKAAQKAAQAAKAAAQATVKFVKVAAKAIVAAVKATVAAVKGIVAAIAAGGWVAVVVILLICMIGLVVGSVFGIFAPNPNSENGITIMQTVREANAEYEAKIAEIKSQYDHDLCFVTGEPCEWSLDIAVYAIKTNRTEDVVTFDEKKAKGLKEVFHSLNRMDIHTKQITVKETRIETQDDGSVVPVEYEVVKTYLYVDTIPLTAAEAAEKYGLDEKQRKQLDELLSDRNKELWEGLLS